MTQHGAAVARTGRLLAELAESVPRYNPLTSGMYTGPFNLLGNGYANYYASLGFTGLFGVVLGFICLLVPICWLAFLLFRTCARACCDCCPVRPRVAPSRTRVLVSHASAGFFGAACVAGAGCVWASGPKLRTTLSHVVDMGVSQVQLTLAQAADVLAVLVSVTPPLQSAGASTADISDAAQQLRSASSSVSTALDDNEDRIKDGLKRLMQATSILGAFLILLVLLAWLGHALVPRRGARHLTGAMNFLQWLFLVLGWVICGITYILYLLISDACLTLPAVLADPVGSGLAKHLPCLDPAFAANASSAARAPVFTAVDGANTALQACSGSGPSVPYMCTPVTLSAAGVYVDRVGACVPGFATAPAAFAATYNATTCASPSVRSQLGTLGGGVAAALQLEAIMPQVDALVSCRVVTAMLEGVNGECGALRGAVRQLFGGLLLCCLAFSALLCAGVWACRNAYPSAEAIAFKLTAEDELDLEEAAAGDAPPPASASTLVTADVSAK